jgi:hypothetical protein
MTQRREDLRRAHACLLETRATIHAEATGQPKRILQAPTGPTETTIEPSVNLSRVANTRPPYAQLRRLWPP